MQSLKAAKNHTAYPDVCKTAIATNANIRRGGEEHTILESAARLRCK